MADYVLIKRGLYYRPDNCGYTGILDEAGRYTEEEAKAHVTPPELVGPYDEPVTMQLASEAAEYTNECFDDLARQHVHDKLTALRKRLESAEAALGQVVTSIGEAISLAEKHRPGSTAGMPAPTIMLAPARAHFAKYAESSPCS